MKQSLINQLIEQEYLKTPAIIKAFKKIERANFAPQEIIQQKGRDFVNQYNAPLSIGFEQTISQPLTVAFMLELLQPQPGDKVLDIGSGSGWQSCLLAQIVGETGFVYAIETIKELKEFGENKASKYNFKNLEFIHGDGSKGLLDQAPFNKIIAAASADQMPDAWQEQLALNGRLVAPIKNSLWLYLKKSKNQFEKKEFPGFSFVLLIQ